MMDNNNLVKLINIMNYRIKGITPIDDIIKLFPIRTENLSIEIGNNIMVFKHMNKISRVYAENNNFLNIEVLKRIGQAYDIEVKGDDIIKVSIFSLQMKNLAGGLV